MGNPRPPTFVPFWRQLYHFTTLIHTQPYSPVLLIIVAAFSSHKNGSIRCGVRIRSSAAAMQKMQQTRLHVWVEQTATLAAQARWRHAGRRYAERGELGYPTQAKAGKSDL